MWLAESKCRWPKAECLIRRRPLFSRNRYNVHALVECDSGSKSFARRREPTVAEVRESRRRTDVLNCSTLAACAKVLADIVNYLGLASRRYKACRDGNSAAHCSDTLRTRTILSLLHTESMSVPNVPVKIVLTHALRSPTLRVLATFI